MNEPKPRAWMRRWAFNGEMPPTPTRGKPMPAKFRLLAVTIKKALPDDVPLYSAADLGVLGTFNDQPKEPR